MLQLCRPRLQARGPTQLPTLPISSASTASVPDASITLKTHIALLKAQSFSFWLILTIMPWSYWCFRKEGPKTLAVPLSSRQTLKEFGVYETVPYHRSCNAKCPPLVYEGSAAFYNM